METDKTILVDTSNIINDFIEGNKKVNKTQFDLHIKNLLKLSSLKKKDIIFVLEGRDNFKYKLFKRYKNDNRVANKKATIFEINGKEYNATELSKLKPTKDTKIKGYVKIGYSVFKEVEFTKKEAIQNATKRVVAQKLRDHIMSKYKTLIIEDFEADDTISYTIQSNPEKTYYIYSNDRIYNLLVPYRNTIIIKHNYRNERTYYLNFTRIFNNSPHPMSYILFLSITSTLFKFKKQYRDDNFFDIIEKTNFNRYWSVIDMIELIFKPKNVIERKKILKSIFEGLVSKYLPSFRDSQLTIESYKNAYKVRKLYIDQLRDKHLEEFKKFEK